MSNELVIADGYPIVLQGLLYLIESTSRYLVRASCHDGAEAIAAIRRWKPPLALIDIGVPQVGRVGVLQAVRSERIATRIIIMADLVHGQDVLAALEAGAHGILFKNASPDTLIDCVDTVFNGGTWLRDEELKPILERGRLWRNEGQRIRNLLTNRERQLVRLIMAGLSNQQIARSMGVGKGTIKTHAHHVYQKLEVPNRLELCLLFQRLGIAQDHPPAEVRISYRSRNPAVNSSPAMNGKQLREVAPVTSGRGSRVEAPTGFITNP